VRKLLAERAPAGLEARSLRWGSYFRIHHRHTAQLRVGRMFIAGDAAHIHSPFGGQGMNTGLQDAWNLVWKLDLAVRGHANEALLDSYTTERHPVIKDVIANTDLLTRALGTPSRLAQTLRNTLIPVVSRLPLFQHAFVTRMSGLGIDYAGSPIVDGGGHRYFDETVRGGGRIGSRFLLIGGGHGDGAGKEAVQQFADSLSHVVELRITDRNETTLVRPDGYVAYSTQHRMEGAELHAVRSVLARQTH
jgi:hypothetical protein